MYAKCEKVILGSTKKKQGTEVEFNELNKLFVNFKAPGFKKDGKCER
jgi:hypothetical protein